jgi:hypothetical protein
MHFSLSGTSVGAKKASEKRIALRDEFWPGEVAWGSGKEAGFFSAPRTLPFILQALSSRKVAINQDPGSVYLELLSRHMGDGIVILTHEEDHAYGAGYSTQKAWRARMRVLEKHGFIKVQKLGSRYAYVLLVHPTIAMTQLFEGGLIIQTLWDAYRNRLTETKATSPQPGTPTSSE